ncbi:NAD(P)/FAD-dependent oxidoreductase [Candidatus Uhrbacteria bacterium]|nr:NAD(P)/FAD-dependent oxidoreductase [Candidatus Uhrbacteria bacterium]
MNSAKATQSPLTWKIRQRDQTLSMYSAHNVSVFWKKPRTRGVFFMLATMNKTYDVIVIDGGVDFHEIKNKTMESMVIKNLYIIGDLLHIRRPSGGYSG